MAILMMMKRYVSCMHPGSELYMSGFYVDDIPVIHATLRHIFMRGDIRRPEPSVR